MNLSIFVLADKVTLWQSDTIASIFSLSIAAAGEGALPFPAFPEHTSVALLVLAWRSH